jgi:hypothetical protein
VKTFQQTRDALDSSLAKANATAELVGNVIVGAALLSAVAIVVAVVALVVAVVRH